MSTEITARLRGERETRDHIIAEVVRADTLPENTNYPDVSKCEVNPTCLDCPLVVCKYEKYDPNREEAGTSNHSWYPRWKSRERHIEIVKYAKKVPGSDAHKVIVTAGYYQLSERQIHRLMQQDREGDLRPFQPPVVHIPATVFKRTTIHNVRFTS